MLRKKSQSPDELSVVPRYEVGSLTHYMVVRNLGPEEFDHFNMVFIGMWAAMDGTSIYISQAKRGCHPENP